MSAVPMPQELVNEEIPEPTPETQTAALAQMLPEAEALPANEVKSAKVDADQAFNNVMKTIAGLAPHEATVENLPGYRKGFLGWLRLLALAFLAVCRKIALLVDTKEQAGIDVDRMRRLRMAMLRSWEACATLGVVQMAPIERIIEGRGSLDTAQDTIDLVGLFRGNWSALEGRTPVTKELLDEADRLAHAARDRLALIGSFGASESAALKSLKDQRDRLWTLLVGAHDLARRAGLLVYGEQLASTKTPSLYSRQGLSRTKATKTKTPPASEAPTA